MTQERMTPALEAWQSCRIGSCQRHGECMYHPCRNTHASPAPEPVASVNEAQRLKGLFAALAADPDACAVSRKYARAALGDRLLTANSVDDSTSAFSSGKGQQA